MAEIAYPEESVSTRVGREGSKWDRRDVDAKRDLSSVKADRAEAKLNGTREETIVQRRFIGKARDA